MGRTAALVICLVVLSSSTAQTSLPRTVKPVHRTMTFGGSTLEIDGNLALVNGFVGPGTFFQDLRSTETATGRQFLKGTNEVHSFPDRLTLKLFIAGPIPRKDDRNRPTKFNPESMMDLKFDAKWKRGLSLRPVKHLTLLTASESQFQDPFERIFPWYVPWNVWIYELVVEDSEVPLDDHLVLYVLNSENKSIVRLSAYL